MKCSYKSMEGGREKWLGIREMRGAGATRFLYHAVYIVS